MGSHVGTLDRGLNHQSEITKTASNDLFYTKAFPVTIATELSREVEIYRFAHSLLADCISRNRNCPINYQKQLMWHQMLNLEQSLANA